jgi:hypothetical protein
VCAVAVVAATAVVPAATPASGMAARDAIADTPRMVVR